MVYIHGVSEKVIPKYQVAVIVLFHWMKEVVMNNINQQEMFEQVIRELEENKLRVQHLLQTSELLDEDGYPSEAAVEIVEKWPWENQKGWFDFINSIWHLKSWGWSEQEEPHEWKKETMVHRYHISTAGWSGNETIIDAMKRNFVLWQCSWVQSRRGGHYIFELSQE